MGFPGGASGKESACHYRRHRRHGLDLWVGKISWRRAGQLTPVFLSGESHGQRSLAGYIIHGVEESDMTEANEHAHMHSYKREGAYKGKNFKITVT